LQISTEAIKALREITGAGIMDCKNALIQAEGDIGRATQVLKERGLVKAEKKANRVAREGLIEVYAHPGGRIGAMVEVNCETDFVARTADFKELAHNLALQVAAMSPTFISQEEIPEDKEVEPSQACLLLQPFIKDPSKTVQDILIEVMARVGERVIVRRFARFELGE